MLKGFRDFVLRGNVVDLAIAVIIGAAFTSVVNSLVADVLNPLIVVNFLVPISTERNCNLVLYFTRRIHSKASRKAQVTDNNSNTSALAQGNNSHANALNKPAGEDKEKNSEEK